MNQHFFDGSFKDMSAPFHAWGSQVHDWIKLESDIAGSSFLRVDAFAPLAGRIGVASV
jgi:hypothetical protein